MPNTNPHLHISRGNSKIGRTPNVSLPPILSCIDTPPCEALCYAQNAFRRHAVVRTAWTDNWVLWHTDPVWFEDSLHIFLLAHKPKYFRWHVSGDIPSTSYLRMMENVACDHPSTLFLAFTKRPVATYVSNLRLIRSHWLGDHSIFPESPNAWVFPRDDLDPFPPTSRALSVMRCPGLCEPCGHRCWTLPDSSIVIFTLHGAGYPYPKQPALPVIDPIA